MPVYEYRCNDCNHRISILTRSFYDSYPKACPDCGSANLHRLFSSFSIHDAGRIFQQEIEEDVEEIRQEEWDKTHPKK